MQTPSCVVSTTDKISRGTSHIVMAKNDITLSGDGYRIDLNNKSIEIDRNAHILSKNGELFSAKLQATLANENKLKKADASGNVKYKTPQYSLTANTMHYDINNVIAKGNVKVLYMQGRLSSDKLTATHKKNVLDTIEASGTAKYSTESYTIEAGRLIYKNNGTLQALNNAHLIYTTPKDIYNIFANAMYATIHKGKIVTVSAKNNLLIKTQGDIIKAHSGTMKNQKIYLSGDVKISGEHGNIFGESAELDMNTGRVILTKSSGMINERSIANTE